MSGAEGARGTTVRIAMWSGPRNISTAMMRAFGARSDCAVSDEPFYAAYLAATGLIHPCATRSSPRSRPTGAGSPRRSSERPGGAPIWYQKHMTHHMLPEFGRDWTDGLVNAFLIRAPEAVLASYAMKRDDFTLEEIGLPTQVALFDREAGRLGRAPPVIEAQDVLANPEGTLRRSFRRRGSTSTIGCCHGPLGGARPTASGRPPGITRSRRPRASGRHATSRASRTCRRR